MPTKFVTSAADPSGFPVSPLPEVGIIGRSNAGKSSLINKLLGQRLARVSATPGKTTLLNFFEVDGEYLLVDMPGYGYAARSHKERQAWSPMIEGYLENRENLRGVILVVDSGRPWSEDESSLCSWLEIRKIPVIVAVNKVDKRTQKEMSAKRKEMGAIPGLLDQVYVSAHTGKGIPELSRTVFEKLVRPC